MRKWLHQPSFTVHPLKSHCSWSGRWVCSTDLLAGGLAFHWNTLDAVGLCHNVLLLCAHTVLTSVFRYRCPRLEIQRREETGYGKNSVGSRINMHPLDYQKLMHMLGIYVWKNFLKWIPPELENPGVSVSQNKHRAETPMCINHVKWVITQPH